MKKDQPERWDQVGRSHGTKISVELERTGEVASQKNQERLEKAPSADRVHIARTSSTF